MTMRMTACLASLLALVVCAQHHDAGAAATLSPSPVPAPETAWWCSVNRDIPCGASYAEARTAFAATVPKLDMDAGDAYLNRIDHGAIQRGNLSATEMIYYYRAHIPESVPR